VSIFSQKFFRAYSCLFFADAVNCQSVQCPLGSIFLRIPCIGLEVGGGYRSYDPTVNSLISPDSHRKMFFGGVGKYLHVHV
jgi:hypothetical protein